MDLIDFCETNPEKIINGLLDKYTEVTGCNIKKADPEMLFIRWLAGIIVQERNYINFVGNQNIPSNASGKYLDSLGEWIFNIKRHNAQSAKCNVLFSIVSKQATAIPIPEGTRITDSEQKLVWRTTSDAVIPIGELSAIVMCQCETSGIIGNNYYPYSINTLIDVDNIKYFDSCKNITVSAGGAEEETDTDYCERMKLTMGAYSTAGSVNSYIYWAKSVSDEIEDVLVVKGQNPAEVDIYALMKDGTAASDTIKAEIIRACNDESVRPLTDYVQVKDPEYFGYQIRLKYFIPKDTDKSLVNFENDINNEINNYIEWQNKKLGRDINPSKLYEKLMKTGIKRVEIEEPIFTKLENGLNSKPPQIAMLESKTITFGGYEDE